MNKQEPASVNEVADTSQKDAPLESNQLENCDDKQTSIKNVVSLGSAPTDAQRQTNTLFDNKDSKKALQATGPTFNASLKRARLTSAILRFSNLYGPKKLWTRMLIVSIASLLMGFVTLILVQNTGIYNFGLSSFTQGLARLTFVKLALNPEVPSATVEAAFNIVFWMVYLVMNIPLIIFSYFKLGKRFTILSIIYVVLNNLFGLALGFIPNVSNIVVFTNANDSQILTDLTKNLVSHPENAQFLTDNFKGALRFIPVIWGYGPDASKAIGLLFYGVVFAVVVGIFYTVIFVTGGCTGGADFISQWFANAKQKSIGGILLYVNTAVLIIGVLLGSYIPGSLVLDNIPANVLNPTTGLPVKDFAWGAPLYFSPNLVTTLFAAVIFGALMDSWFPRYRLARVEIFTDKIKDIRDLLINDKNPHSLSIQDIIGGYSMDKRQIIVTISMYIEVPRLIRLIRTVDKNCLLSITTIRGIDGYVYITESTEA
ncbi:YitT family protein [[Mycoplasma] testudinis]|uniref:YitT family protein n=1 Tax=[Mycoplasma] testudinis TaxID=33924 RepID=UPI000696A19E|nr:YitT family protein [[Mycoplasma] testudinis]